MRGENERTSLAYGDPLSGVGCRARRGSLACNTILEAWEACTYAPSQFEADRVQKSCDLFRAREASSYNILPQ